MGSFEEFDTALHGTKIVQRVRRSLTIEATQALQQICREFERTGKPLPDHHLSSGGYMGEMIVKALIEAGLIEETEAERRAVRQYGPTERGRAFYRALLEENAFAQRS